MSTNRIVELLPVFSGKGTDGVSYVVIRLCESIYQSDFDIVLASCKVMLYKDNPVFLQKFNYIFWRDRLFLSPELYKWLKNGAKINSISLLHSHGLWTMPGIYSGWIKAKYSVPLIVSPHGSLAPWAFKSGSQLKKYFWKMLQRSMLKRATCFHATAMSEYRDIRRMGFKQPVAIIPNGVDIPDKIEIEPQTMRTLLFLGRIHPIKGIEHLLHSWKTLQDKFPQWQLEIVGSGDRIYFNSVKKLALDLNLERIKFCGELHGKDKLAAFQRAELFVLPSYSENFGVTVAESLVSGTPVIVTKSTPWSKLEHYKAGWWIDIHDLAMYLENALSLPPAILEEMGQQGKHWVVKDFSWDRVGAMMQETYTWLINGGKAPDWVRFD